MLASLVTPVKLIRVIFSQITVKDANAKCKQESEAIAI
jgi:hypothetical protein